MRAGALRLAPAWRAHLHAAADCPPRRPRVPLTWRGERIGSVEPELFERAALVGSPLLRWRDVQGTWEVVGELSASLAWIAFALRDRGLAHAWRDEQLAVRNEAGAVLGTVERAVVRPLGIATQAVHLVAIGRGGAHWVQQRAFDKATDPGLWDTLVGGMVPARDSVEEALARETWEEAGLRLEQVRDLRYGGRLLTRRPFRELAHGYVVEAIEWYACTLPPGVAPANQDGEVAGFRCMEPAEVEGRLEAEGFTIDASLVLEAAFASR
ncbi:NUDIX hydrolase [Ramlibacter alkalitolerans]|uniref:NUDIX domain-containing protein n=1 Tax=Ramlibacter alkalitolerans TaxID=2039631 RepID=A0ABS1JRY9_9BURK|nr:NUDIX domain-containing protein [Ramlibacter alkalitolerans]MBL0426978.1 NUDIX domain-containing protein [Ramlibacter alkalitolerans]